MQEEEREFEQTVAFLELETQEIEDEVQNSLEEVHILKNTFASRHILLEPSESFVNFLNGVLSKFMRRKNHNKLLILW